MTNVNIDEEFYEKIVKLTEEDKLEYPSITNFVNKAVKEKLEKMKEE